MPIETILRSADQAAKVALDIVLFDNGNVANPELQKVLVLCKDLRQRSYYLDYFRLRRKLEGVDALWLQRAIQRINLAIFTAAVWNGDEVDDLEMATKDYFTKVIPRSIECTDKIVDAYLEVRMQLAYREIVARMATSEEVDAMEVINVYCPKQLIDYNLPANKSGRERVLIRAAKIIDEFCENINDINEDMNRRFPKIRMQEAWQTALIMDIEENLHLIYSPEDEPTPLASVAPPPEPMDIPMNTTSTSKPTDSVSQSSPKEDAHDDSDYQPKDDDDEDDDDPSTASDSDYNDNNKRKRNTAQPQRQGKEKLRKLTERWTSEETEALKKGYQECGFGQWGMIKMKYSQQLQNRTIQQLKDKARNIAKAFERSGQPLGKWEAALR